MGSDIVQLYVAPPPQTRVFRPRRELKGCDVLQPDGGPRPGTVGANGVDVAEVRTLHIARPIEVDADVGGRWMAGVDGRWR